MKTIPLLVALILASPAAAQGRKNVLETLSAALASDPGYEPADREALMSAIKTRFADYGVQVVNAQRAKAIPVVLHILTEGSFDESPPERIADVAFAAYQAMSRGADSEVVEGVALYGYRKKISADTLSTWANGYKQLTDGKVPGDVAADLVHISMEKNLPDSDFNTLKWALVEGVKNGFDPKDYASYLFGHLLAGKSGPGKISGEAKAAFLKARRLKTNPLSPHTRACSPRSCLPSPDMCRLLPFMRLPRINPSLRDRREARRGDRQGVSNCAGAAVPPRPPLKPRRLRRQPPQPHRSSSSYGPASTRPLAPTSARRMSGAA